MPGHVQGPLPPLVSNFHSAQSVDEEPDLSPAVPLLLKAPPAPSLLSLAAWHLLLTLPAHVSCLAWEATGSLSFSASGSAHASWGSCMLLKV